MRLICLLTVLLLGSPGYAGVSDESSHLESLRKAIEPSPSSEIEQRYLDAFPATFVKFRSMFDSDELYRTHIDHLELLEKLFEKYPEKVIAIWLGVATNGVWDADAIGILQDQLAKYGAKDTNGFAKALLGRSSQQRSSIIRFLADVENHHAYPEYQTIMVNLKALGYGGLYDLFASAKTERMKRRDH